jgi:hypothetical protein
VQVGDAFAPSPEAALAALRCDVITTGRLAVAQADAGNLEAANAAVHRCEIAHTGSTTARHAVGADTD